LTLKYKASEEKIKELKKYYTPGITKDNIEIPEKEKRKYEKYGYFSSLFLSQYY